MFPASVLDTAGQDEFSAMREQYMRKGHGFIVVYSVTDPQSFRQVRRFHTQILRARDRDSYPMILAANKIDLVQQRVVSEEEGRSLAQELGVSQLVLSFSSFCILCCLYNLGLMGVNMVSQICSCCLPVGYIA